MDDNTPPLGRRPITFDTPDEAVAEARQLLETGYVRGGQWSLAENCEHLTIFMTQSLDGFEIGLPGFIGWIGGKILLPRIMNHGLGRYAAPKAFQPRDTPAEALDPEAQHARDAEAVDAFAAVIDRLKDAGFACVRSPLLGKLTPEQWQRLHLIHAAHHLGHLHPASQAT